MDIPFLNLVCIGDRGVNATVAAERSGELHSQESSISEKNYQLSITNFGIGNW